MEEVNLTKEELMAEIYRIDPSYKRLNIDLNKYTEAELLKHYLRKKNAPISTLRNGKTNWYTDTTPVRRVTPKERTDGFEEVTPSSTTHKKEANKSVALTGFDALRKE